jgi:peptidoglycan/LPS O-acetylase OafA/YrhL
MFGLAVLFWVALAAMLEGSNWVFRDVGPRLLFMLAGISNILPGIGFPPVGPWWFIPFIMQFYAIWPLLRRLTNKFGWPGLVVLSFVCYLATRAANPVLAHWLINLAETPIGRMRVFCFGILAARYPIRLNAYLAVPALAIMILGSEYLTVAHFVSLSAVILSLWLYIKTRALLRRFALLEQIGNYSLAIFLVNGIVRVPFLAFARTPLSQLVLGCASAVVTLAISVFFHYLLEPSSESASTVRVRAVLTRPTSEPVSIMAD